METEKMADIGKINAEKLAKADIHTAEKLRELGSKNAFLQIRLKANNKACLPTLYALESAVQNLPRGCLPAERKRELEEFYKGLQG